jgi:hypothetical protein
VDEARSRRRRQQRRKWNQIVQSCVCVSRGLPPSFPRLEISAFSGFDTEFRFSRSQLGKSLFCGSSAKPNLPFRRHCRGLAALASRCCLIQPCCHGLLSLAHNPPPAAHRYCFLALFCTSLQAGRSQCCASPTAADAHHSRPCLCPTKRRTCPCRGALHFPPNQQTSIAFYLFRQLRCTH